MYQKGLAANFILVTILVIAVILGGLFYIRTQNVDQISQQQTQSDENMEVVIKENPDDKRKSDIYLKSKNGREEYFITAEDVYIHHIHNSEYHNGNLYIIRRPGGEEGYKDNPDWTDELWKYDKNKKGSKLYSLRGLDFRVSNDEKIIAIIGYETDELEMLVLIDTDGNTLAEFGGDDLGVSLMQPLVWGRNSFWLVNLHIPYPKAFIRIDLDPYEAAIFDVEEVNIGMEYEVNPDTQKVVYSNYPPLFDVDSAKEYEQSGKNVTLSVYDLVSKQKRIIDTSITKKFNPKWVDENILEYDNPKGEGRITKKIL